MILEKSAEDIAKCKEIIDNLEKLGVDWDTIKELREWLSRIKEVS